MFGKSKIEDPTLFAKEVDDKINQFYDQKKKEIQRSNIVGTRVYQKQKVFDDQYFEETLKDMKLPKLTRLIVYYHLDQQKQENCRIVGIQSDYFSYSMQTTTQKHIGTFKGNIEEYHIQLTTKKVGEEWIEECIDQIIVHLRDNQVIGLDFLITGIPNMLHVGGKAHQQDQVIILNQPQFTKESKKRIVGFGGTMGQFLDSFYVVTRQSTGFSVQIVPFQMKDKINLVNIIDGIMIDQQSLKQPFNRSLQQPYKGQIIPQLIGKLQVGQRIFDWPNGTDIARLGSQYKIFKLDLKATRDSNGLSHIFSFQVTYKFKDQKYAITKPLVMNDPKTQLDYEVEVSLEDSEVIQGLIGQSDNQGISYIRFIIYDAEVEDTRCIDVGTFNQKLQNTMIGDGNTQICGFGGSYNKYLESLYAIKE